MAYKYNKTIMNGAEELIDGIENIEMFLDDNDDWNFHDSEIRSFYWDRAKRTFSVTIEPFGCDYPDIEEYDKDSAMILDFHFVDVVEVHMPHVNLWSPEYVYEIEISKDRDWIECWFNGFCMRVASKRLQVDKPRVIKKDK